MQLIGQLVAPPEVIPRGFKYPGCWSIRMVRPLARDFSGALSLDEQDGELHTLRLSRSSGGASLIGRLIQLGAPRRTRSRIRVHGHRVRWNQRTRHEPHGDHGGDQHERGDG